MVGGGGLPASKGALVYRQDGQSCPLLLEPSYPCSLSRPKRDTGQDTLWVASFKGPSRDLCFCNWGLQSESLPGYGCATASS